jgi:hypothetical protein
MVKVQVVSENMDTKFKVYSMPFIIPDEITDGYSMMIEQEVKAFRLVNPNSRVFVLYENLEVEND